MRANPTAVLAIAVILVGYGIFGLDRSGATTRPSFFIGLALMAISLLLLVRAGWRGSRSSWVVAAIGAVIGTWTVYELLRQSVCPLIDDRTTMIACLTAYGEMTAPVLSATAGAIVLAVGWLRLQGRNH
jgi:hypothetical protein